MTEGELYLRRLRGMIQMIEPSLDDEKVDEYLAMWWSDAGATIRHSLARRSAAVKLLLLQTVLTGQT